MSCLKNPTNKAETRSMCNLHGQVSNYCNRNINYQEYSSPISSGTRDDVHTYVRVNVTCYWEMLKISTEDI